VLAEIDEVIEIEAMSAIEADIAPIQAPSSLLVCAVEGTQ
jgi:hypothetical protein